MVSARARAAVVVVMLVVVVVAVTLAIRSGSSTEPPPGPTAASTTPHEHETTDAPEGEPLRKGESFLDLKMTEPYTPKAPTSPGTDDYRCFLLDPEFTDPAFITGLNVVPGRAEMVHHVVHFKIGPGEVAAAEARDDAQPGPGWTCFGGPGLDSGGPDALQTAPWLGAWVPGGGESIFDDDVGIRMKPGSRLVMQVHYNLLGGKGEDTSSTRLRVAPGTADLEPLTGLLSVAPIELACRKGKFGDLCDRDAAVRDVVTRFGDQADSMLKGLQVICGTGSGTPKASPVQSCDQRISKPSTIRAMAGHMHRLGKSISLTLNPGTSRERVLLDIKSWNFDDQRSRPLARPAKMQPGDILRITCRHDQKLRDVVPELEGRPERYVVWGDGTADEMCLGVSLITTP
jgi:hypothetical protein